MTTWQQWVLAAEAVFSGMLAIVFRLQTDPEFGESFTRIMQGWFDGFLMGYEFHEKGGHRE